MARKATKKTTQKKEVQEANNNVFDYFRFGESYTSLVLGIIVVIVATVLLLAFVHNRQAGKTVQQAEQAQNEPIQISDTVALTITQEVPAKATVVPTKTSVPTKIKPTATPLPPKPAAKQAMGKTYTVQAGDDLWTIAEKTYKSGYNWVAIAKANNLSNPSDIHAGNKLVLPKVTPQTATVSKKPEKKTVTITPTKKPAPTATPTQSEVGKKIVGTSYKVVAGDSLWTIAVRAYGDGYRWDDIAKANKLTDPGVIHVGNTIKIPRK